MRAIVLATLLMVSYAANIFDWCHREWKPIDTFGYRREPAPASWNYRFVRLSTGNNGMSCEDASALCKICWDAKLPVNIAELITTPFCTGYYQVRGDPAWLSVSNESSLGLEVQKSMYNMTFASMTTNSNKSAVIMNKPEYKFDNLITHDFYEALPKLEVVCQVPIRQMCHKWRVRQPCDCSERAYGCYAVEFDAGHDGENATDGNCTSRRQRPIGTLPTPVQFSNPEAVRCHTNECSLLKNIRCHTEDDFTEWSDWSHCSAASCTQPNGVSVSKRQPINPSGLQGDIEELRSRNCSMVGCDRLWS